MIGDVLQPTHLIFILVIALIVLGPKRLPEVGRSLGKGIRDFRGALSGSDEPEPRPPAPPAEVTPAPPVTPATTTMTAPETPEPVLEPDASEEALHGAPEPLQAPMPAGEAISEPEVSRPAAPAPDTAQHH